MKTLFQCVVLLFLSSAVCSARIHPPAHRTPLNLHLVHLCQAFADSFPRTDDDKQLKVDDHYQRLAARYFSHLSQEELRRQIEPLIPRLYPGHRAAICAAYTLAYFGIDVQKNVRRILFINEVTPGPGGLPDDVDVAWDVVPDLVDQIYRRHPSDAVLLPYVELHSDGCYQEEIVYLHSEIFVAYPVQVLRVAAQHDRARRELAEALSEVPPDEDPHIEQKISSTLRRMRRYPNAQVERTARWLQWWLTLPSERRGDL